MQNCDRQRIKAFLEKWLGSEGNERANYQTFFGDLCVALEVEGPPPKGNVEDDPYCFDKDIKFFGSGKKSTTTRYADFYKQDCFLIEAKQGSDSSAKGHGKRGTKSYFDALHGAFNQAKSYAYNRALGSFPPFLMVCDIGSHFEVWEGFDGEYGSYGARQRVNLKDLEQPEVFDRFVKIFTDPQALNPAKLRARVTREVAAELATLSRWLEEEGDYSPEVTASFLMRCIFTMFAEDVALLRGELFTKGLRDRWIPDPTTFQPELEGLWRTMNTGGMFGYERVLQFNGSFFEDATVLPLPKEQLEVLYRAAAKDWASVEPAIFGTLLERALGKQERKKLGAHYTPRSYVERLVRPVVMEPLRQEWDEIEIEVKRLLTPPDGKKEATKGARKKAVGEIGGFLEKLRTIKILDPACGTGNFLYVALDLLKGLEVEVATRLADVAGEVQLDVLEQVDPSQFLGIEINPRAAAIAELVIWIGYLQWFFKRYDNTEPPEPVLRAFGNIECRDAVLAYDGKEPDKDPTTGEVRTRWGGKTMKHPVTGEEVPDPSDQKVIYRYLNPRQADWPEADYIISNPPFIGNSRMPDTLDDGYVTALRNAYSDVPKTVDYVMYWWHKSAIDVRQVSRAVKGFGFITTNSITQPRSRKLVGQHTLAKKNALKLTFAIPDHPWTDNGAAVRIAMTAAAPSDRKQSGLALIGNVFSEFKEIDPESAASKLKLNLRKVAVINSDLSSGVDKDQAKPLRAQSSICSDGVKIYGDGFILDRDRVLLLNASSQKLIKRYSSGQDISKKDRGLFVIDCFGIDRESTLEREHPQIYQFLLDRVYPSRKVEKDSKIRDKWWLFERNRPDLRKSLTRLSRYIVTLDTSKHRFFTFLKSSTLPDVQLTVFALDDAYHLGILSSYAHTLWALVSGGTLENRPRYKKKRCFDPFPFPDSTPEQKEKIRELGDRLDSHRKQVQAQHPDITITGMYNLLEKLRAGEEFSDKDREFNNRALVSTLKQIHDELDIAVLDAYGWDHDITDDQILENLVKLNAERAEEERNGHVRWLRPEYQAPDEIQTQQTIIEGTGVTEEPTIEPVDQQKWPTNPKAQLTAIRDLLRTNPGDWTLKQIASQFKGKITDKKLTTIRDNLDRLEWFGTVIQHTDGDRQYWHYTDPAIAP